MMQKTRQKNLPWYVDAEIGDPDLTFPQHKVPAQKYQERGKFGSINQDKYLIDAGMETGTFSSAVGDTTQHAVLK